MARHNRTMTTLRAILETQLEARALSARTSSPVAELLQRNLEHTVWNYKCVVAPHRAPIAGIIVLNPNGTPAGTGGSDGDDGGPLMQLVIKGRALLHTTRVCSWRLRCCITYLRLLADPVGVQTALLIITRGLRGLEATEFSSTAMGQLLRTVGDQRYSLTVQCTLSFYRHCHLLIYSLVIILHLILFDYWDPMDSMPPVRSDMELVMAEEAALKIL